MVRGSADIQNNNVVFITLKPSESVLNASNASQISQSNLLQNAVFVSVRKVVAKTWINDRDQYLYPNSSWGGDVEFINNCLAFALFDQSNAVKTSDGINHWIPFTETEVNAKEKFTSNFMSKFIQGKIKPEEKVDLLSCTESEAPREVALKFSPEATAVFDAGRALWTYYHAQPQCNVNAALYDIREHFQGRNDKGKMNNKSTDEVYAGHIAALRGALKLLAQKIEPKVYGHRFLL